jgi:hypothetical protein
MGLGTMAVFIEPWVVQGHGVHALGSSGFSQPSLDLGEVFDYLFDPPVFLLSSVDQLISTLIALGSVILHLIK